MLQFEYNGHSSEEFGLLLTSIEENENVFSRSLILGEKNKYRTRENHFGATYDENYKFVIKFIKNPCLRIGSTPSLENGCVVYDQKCTPTLDNGTIYFSTFYSIKIQNGILLSENNTDYFSMNDVRQITAWLTSPQFPKLFKLINSEYLSEDVDFFATITSVELDNIKNPYQISCTVTCDSNYGYTPEIVNHIDSISTLTNSVTLTNNSDCLEDYVYPIIKVSPKSHGTITIKNTSDNNGTMKINALKNDDFYIDCQKLKIYDITNSIVSLEDLGIEDIGDIYWPRLIYGENVFEFTGDASFEISYREPRKVGVFA